MSSEEFWQQRYNVVREEYQLLEIQLQGVYDTLREIKIDLHAGDVVDALIKLGEFTNDGGVHLHKPKVIETEGYQWSQ